MGDFDEVWRLHGASVARVAASYAPPGADREDLLQEIAVAIYRALGRHRGESSVRTYVLRIAHNCGMKRVTRRPAATALLEESEHAVASPGPEQLVSGRQEADRIAAAIRTLPIGQRQVLALALEQLSLVEIAEVLALQENAVAVRLHRARAALRERLRDNDHAATGATHG